MGSRCIAPGYTNTVNRRNQPFPCGKCPNCKKRRTSGWSFRLMQEDKHSFSSLFITLTYDSSHVPITRNGYMCLSPRDTQLFFKRLRKYHSDRDQNAKITYYIAGEYGSKTNRPHYHIILFNSSVEACKMAWTLGDIHAGNVSGASIGYTLKYISKPSRIPLHAKDDRIPEFSHMSKGIGKDYLTPETVAWHKNWRDLEKRMFCQVGNKKLSMPRYYKDKIYNDIDKIKIQRHFEKLESEKPEIPYHVRAMHDLQNIKSFITRYREQNKDKI